MDRNLAEATLQSARADYQIVESRGIPIGGNVTTQLARVLAPMDGVVIKRGGEPGDTITSGVSSFNAGTVLFTVADLQSLIVKVDLYEVDIAKVSVGQAGRSKSVWLSEHWRDYFEAVPVQAGLATLERVEIRSGLAPGDQVSLEDPTRKRVERDDDSY